MTVRLPIFEIDGDDSARRLNAVFAENAVDLLDKWEEGSPDYPRGFLHTSTIQHEGTCYFNYAWTRDAGRALTEIARMGCIEEAKDSVRFFLANKNAGSHWRRLAAQSLAQQHDVAGESCEYELDGDALMLLAFYNVWRFDGEKSAFAEELLDGTASVVTWMETLMDACRFGDLIPSRSELSGNPTGGAPLVLGIYPNFHAHLALRGLERMAAHVGRSAEAERCGRLASRLVVAMKERLVAVPRIVAPLTSVSPGCWMNGLDAETGKPFENSVWGVLTFPVWHWTRQIPFIGYADLGYLSIPEDGMEEIHRNSYRFLMEHMNRSRFFRKYGFVSNTAWSGTAGTHDDTMCGYGQGFVTQAALLMDDVNTYTKCLEGLSTLAYDGGVTEPASFEMNPWLFHECFSFENFEEGRDHTFGNLGNNVNIFDNPGDEGSMVQQAEPMKALLLVAGVAVDGTGVLRLKPRMPWNWSRLKVSGMPYCGRNGCGRLDMELVHQRHLRKLTVHLESTQDLDGASFRAGPFPMYTRPEDDSFSVEVLGGAAWFTRSGLTGRTVDFEVVLRRGIRG